MLIANAEAVVQVIVILPVPNVICLVFEVLEEKIPVDKVRLDRFKVPNVRLNVLVVPRVRAEPSVRVAPDAFIVTGKSISFPFVVNVFVPVPVNVNALVPAVKDIVDEIVTFP